MWKQEKKGKKGIGDTRLAIFSRSQNTNMLILRAPSLEKQRRN